MLTRSSVQNTARRVTYAIGAALVAFIALSATWIILRDRENARASADLHLRNFTAVLAEQTRLELNDAPRDIKAALDGAAGGQAAKPPAIDEIFHGYFSGLYGGLEIAYSGRVFLFRSDGFLLTAVPRASAPIGRSYLDHPLFRDGLANHDDGTTETRGIAGDDQRLIGYRRVRGYPAIVAISVSMNEVLEPWRRLAMGMVSGALVLAALACLATWLLARQFGATGTLMREVAENEQRLDSIIDSAMDAIITVDEAQRVVLFNGTAEKIFRCKAAEAIGAPLDRFIPQRYRAQHASHVKRFGEAGVTMRRMGGELVLAGLRADGEEFPIDASISHVTVGGNKFYTVILRDITERQRAADALARSNEELREMYESMHQVREAERTRIARELHDELAQWLTALKMDVSWMRTRLPQDEAQLVTKADRMKGVVDSTIAAMRRIAADLRPVMLDDLGLMAAVENLLHDLSERTGVQVSLNGSEALESLREPLVTAVYRMIQEALTNVARHSQATEVAVSLEIADGRLAVTVRDNGTGLNPDPNRKSFGLLGIRERARTLGGEARIYSPPEGGAVVEIEVPLARHAETEARA